MMKGPFAVALATGTLVVVAYGGFAMAVEVEDSGDPVVVVTATSSPEEPSGEEASGDASSLDAPTENGLVCVLEVDELDVEEIVCSGTGNERSAEVALVPRYLAHSDELSGAEKGAAISAWAKTHANKKSGDKDDDEVLVDEGGETSGDVSEPPSDEPSSGSPGRSGDAPGHSGSQPGNGRGR